MKPYALDLIEKRLDSLLQIQKCPQQELIEAARYSTLGPGKRLRPLLLLAVLEGHKIPLEKGVDPACALEFIHTYSLIHDDLPCMDNDYMRRGRLTLHKEYSEGLAVLTGDFLFTYAMEVVTNAQDLSSLQKLKIINTLSSRAGLQGMIGGQVIDIHAERLCKDVETLYLMHSYKTASLFIASLEIGGIIANISQKELEKLQSCGKALGIAFQMLNDLQDPHPTSPSSAVTILGKDTTAENSAMLLQEALHLAQALSIRCPLLERLIEEVLQIPTTV